MTNDLNAPRLFTVINTSTVSYNMDTVEYLLDQERKRRALAIQPALSYQEEAQFKRQLISTLIIQGNALAAIALRPGQSSKQQLNG